MIDLERDLALLGDRLAVDADGLVDDVLARVGRAPRPTRAARWLVAAAVAAVIVGAALAVPSSRRVIADWFGLDGVTIEERPDLTVPPDVWNQLPTGVTVDELDGTLGDDRIVKVLGAGTGIERVDVDGRPGLWIDGAPHELLIEDPGGATVLHRFAGNTLLWQDGGTIRRVEGAATLDAALAVARSLP